MEKLTRLLNVKLLNFSSSWPFWLFWGYIISTISRRHGRVAFRKPYFIKMLVFSASICYSILKDGNILVYWSFFPAFTHNPFGRETGLFHPQWYHTARESYFYNIMFKYHWAHKTNVFTRAIAGHSYKIDIHAFFLAGRMKTEHLGLLDLFPITVRTQRLRPGRQEESILRQLQQEVSGQSRVS